MNENISNHTQICQMFIMRCVDVMPHQMKGTRDLHIFSILNMKDKLFKVFNLLGPFVG